jgi:alpha-L-rhamnosidase
MTSRSLDRFLLTLFILPLVPVSISNSQTINPDLLRQNWTASWIGHSRGPEREFGVFHFRKSFSLDRMPERFVIHASGDNRYELFVNGKRVLEGPARGDLDHWRFETLDIATYLHAGKNLLAAVVWNFAEQAPMAQMTNETGLLVQGDRAAEQVVDTDPSWKVFKSRAVEMIPVDMAKLQGYFVAGPGERLDGSKYPWGWQDPDFDDSSWEPAVIVSGSSPRAIQDTHSRWFLIPRSIPLMEEKPERLARVARTRGVQASQEFLEGKTPVTVPADTHAALLLDNQVLTTAYPELVTSDGRGAEITLTYAEALFKDHEKGNRNETVGKEIMGYSDQFLPDGGEHRLFRPLWWRTYRYLEVDVVTKSEPVVLEDMRGEFTAYPFTLRARFESDDPELEKIMQVGWRTARLCAHETYMDCPYYEQLQYVGDTRIQALISLYNTGDDRLVKNAIELINESRIPEGLTQSRYPSWLPQFIPPFSLYWIGMMHDLWWYRGDVDFLRSYLPGTRSALEWFESRLSPSGLLGRLEWWDFVDWTKEFEDGVPTQAQDGQSAIISLQFVGALREAADLESAFGRTERANHYRNLAAKISAAVYKNCWDPSRHLIADTSARKHFSQHANVLAVLHDVVPATEQKAILKIVLSDPTLTQCSYYFRFYLFRALKKAGLGDLYLAQLGPWRQMLALGLTTWAETPEPTRSDCHAWTAHPNFDLLATVAGIEPAVAGFHEVAIRPHLGSLKRLKAELLHPQGVISVAYQRDGESLVADVTLPEKLTGWFYWDGKKVPLHGGRQHLMF